MHSRILIAGTAFGGVLVALLLWNREKIAEISSTITRTVEEAGNKVSGNAGTSAATAFNLTGPGEVVAQTLANIALPYGSVTIKPGTRLWALRQSGGGVVTKFAGFEVTLPARYFARLTD